MTREQARALVLRHCDAPLITRLDVAAYLRSLDRGVEGYGHALADHLIRDLLQNSSSKGHN